MNMSSSSSSSFSAATATAGAAASASAISPQEKHEVFLSFRGEDTRNGFTSYLYDGLCRKQILTYMDDHQLERGDEISPTLLKAIKESKISVIIFSENYASSTWCLDEVVKILECKKKNRQTVIPIFYDIEPSVVRKQEESYAEAFAKLEERFKDNMDKVQQWRHALNEAAGLKGFNSMQFRPENTLIQKIVEDISLLLHKYPSSYEQFKGLIGIEKRIEEIESLICIRSMDVRIIGIWGMGGIGKTTLASAIFQKFSYSHFEGYCFLWNVKEESARHGLHHLREKLLGELLKDEAIVCKATSFVQSTYIQDRLRCKKEMGWAIVRDEHKLPGNRSRLWIAEDVCHVLERDTGTATIEGILFNMSKVKKDVKVSPIAFSNMYNLRFLKIYYDKIKNEDSNCKLCLPQGLDSYLSDRLRYFHWDLYPLKHLP